MGWFQQLFNKRVFKNDMQLNSPTFIEWFTGGTGPVNVKGRNALKQATVYTCVRILSDTMSKLPCKLIQEGQGIQQITDNYLVPMVKLRPNPYMSARDFWAAIESQRNLRGNGYAYIDFAGNGRIRGLYPLQSDSVEIWMDDEGLFNSQNKIWYIVTLKTGERVKLTPLQILHFKTFTLDGISGITPVEYLRTTLESGKSSEEFVKKFFEKGLSVKGVIQYTGELTPEQKKKFLEKFEEMSTGLNNSHGVSMLPIGYQFQPIALSMVDAQFLENTKLNAQQIGAAFGIKMHQLNDLTQAKFNNVELQQLEFYTDTMQTIITAYEQELTYKLLLDSEIRAGKAFKFNINVIIRADIKTRYEAYRTGIQGGFITPNEARAWEDLPPKEGGDDLICNGNMQKITEIGAYYKNNSIGGGS